MNTPPPPPDDWDWATDGTWLPCTHDGCRVAIWAQTRNSGAVVIGNYTLKRALNLGMGLTDAIEEVQALADKVNDAMRDKDDD